MQASKKIADAKLAKDFQAVLKEFQKAQRLAAERETAYAPFVPQAVLPTRYVSWTDLLAQLLEVLKNNMNNDSVARVRVLFFLFFVLLRGGGLF